MVDWKRIDGTTIPSGVAIDPGALAADTSGITGTLAVTENGDSMAFTGQLGALATRDSTRYTSMHIMGWPTSIRNAFSQTASGTMAVTEAVDTMAASGHVAPFERSSTRITSFTVAGWMSSVRPYWLLNITGTMSVGEAADTMSASGTLSVSGTLAVTENPDLMNFRALVDNPITGTMVVHENPDTMEFTGQAVPVPRGAYGAGGRGRVMHFTPFERKIRKLSKSEIEEARRLLRKEAIKAPRKLVSLENQSRELLTLSKDIHRIQRDIEKFQIISERVRDTSQQIAEEEELLVILAEAA